MQRMQEYMQDFTKPQVTWAFAGDVKNGIIMMSMTNN